MLKEVKNFILKIESRAKNINLSLLKVLINVKNPNENKEIVAKMKNRILDLKDRIKEMSKNEKK